jgi:hypothetical protein
MVRKSRIACLEARQRRQHPAGEHFISVVRVPWGEDSADDLAALSCLCGQVGCPDRRIGRLVPDKAPSSQAWVERVQAYEARKRREGCPDDAA